MQLLIHLRIPAVKERLNISVTCLNILLLRSLTIFVDILFRPVDLHLLSEEIIFDISFPCCRSYNELQEVIGWKEILSDLIENQIFETEVKQIVTWICNINMFYDELFIMNYWCRNIVVATFHKYNWFNAFQCFFNAINKVF